MTRRLIVFAAFAAAFALRAAVADPTPRIPSYVHPATAADEAGVPNGAPPEPRDGGVWYPQPTHHRLATMLAAVEPLSTARATRAWAWGYSDGRMAAVDECEAERARRVEAEARSDGVMMGYVAAGAVGLALGALLVVTLGGAE